MRMNAYYFGFARTEVEAIDRILSAVACAGKAYHHTQDWNDPIEPWEPFLRGETCAEWIQRAADDAAKALVDFKVREISARALLERWVEAADIGLDRERIADTHAFLGEGGEGVR